MEKNYFNDFRPFPIDIAQMQCCDCRNEFKIELIESYLHSPRAFLFCPVCGARADGKDPSFREVNNVR